MNEEQDSFGMPATATGSGVRADDLEDLGRDIASLRSLVMLVLGGLLLLSLAVNIFMWRQVRIVRTQLHDERTQIARFQKAEPAIHDFFKKLQAFAAVHPDFQPIVRKYSVKGSATTTTNAPTPRGRQP